MVMGESLRLLLLLLVVHQAGTDAALLSHLYAVLVSQLVNLLNQLLHLLHDGLVLLLILLLGRVLLLLLVARGEVRSLLLRLLLRLLWGLVPGVRNIVTAGSAPTALLGLAGSLF